MLLSAHIYPYSNRYKSQQVRLSCEGLDDDNEDEEDMTYGLEEDCKLIAAKVSSYYLNSLFNYVQHITVV